MKTPEDEAFDELARKQGSWGGGFKAKSEAAAARFKDGVQWWMDTETYGACPNPPQWYIDTGNLVRLVPQRPWVGLTEQQIKILLSDSKCWIGDDCSMPNLNYIVRLVEKAHGIGE